MSRIAATFEALKQQGSKALIPFITAGDPDPGLAVPLMHALAKAGADVIELGVPFSDPMADGPVIQRSSERALKHGVSLRDVLGFVAEFRKTDRRTPVVLFGYANPIESMGLERFADAAKAADADGVLVVDYPPEEAQQLVRDARCARPRHDIPALADHDRRAARADRGAWPRLPLLRLAAGRDRRLQHRSRRRRRARAARARVHAAAGGRGLRHPRCGDRASASPRCPTPSSSAAR